MQETYIPMATQGRTVLKRGRNKN